jgi:hypothetical protein
MDNAIGFIVSAKRYRDYSDEKIDWALLSKGTWSLPIAIIPIQLRPFHIIQQPGLAVIVQSVVAHTSCSDTQ